MVQRGKSQDSEIVWEAALHHVRAFPTALREKEARYSQRFEDQLYERWKYEILDAVHRLSDHRRLWKQEHGLNVNAIPNPDTRAANILEIALNDFATEATDLINLHDYMKNNGAPRPLLAAYRYDMRDYALRLRKRVREWEEDMHMRPPRRHRPSRPRKKEDPAAVLSFLKVFQKGFDYWAKLKQAYSTGRAQRPDAQNKSRCDAQKDREELSSTVKEAYHESGKKTSWEEFLTNFLEAYKKYDSQHNSRDGINWLDVLSDLRKAYNGELYNHNGQHESQGDEERQRNGGSRHSSRHQTEKDGNRDREEPSPEAGEQNNEWRAKFQAAKGILKKTSKSDPAGQSNFYNSPRDEAALAHERAAAADRAKERATNRDQAFRKRGWSPVPDHEYKAARGSKRAKRKKHASKLSKGHAVPDSLDDAPSVDDWIEGLDDADDPKPEDPSTASYMMSGATTSNGGAANSYYKNHPDYDSQYGAPLPKTKKSKSRSRTPSVPRSSDSWKKTNAEESSFHASPTSSKKAAHASDRPQRSRRGSDAGSEETIRPDRRGGTKSGVSKASWKARDAGDDCREPPDVAHSFHPSDSISQAGSKHSRSGQEHSSANYAETVGPSDSISQAGSRRSHRSKHSHREPSEHSSRHSKHSHRDPSEHSSHRSKHSHREPSEHSSHHSKHSHRDPSEYGSHHSKHSHREPSEHNSHRNAPSEADETRSRASSRHSEREADPGSTRSSASKAPSEANSSKSGATSHRPTPDHASGFSEAAWSNVPSHASQTRASQYSNATKASKHPGSQDRNPQSDAASNMGSTTSKARDKTAGTERTAHPQAHSTVGSETSHASKKSSATERSARPSAPSNVGSATSKASRRSKTANAEQSAQCDTKSNIGSQTSKAGKASKHSSASHPYAASNVGGSFSSAAKPDGRAPSIAGSKAAFSTFSEYPGSADVPGGGSAAPDPSVFEPAMSTAGGKAFSEFSEYGSNGSPSSRFSADPPPSVSEAGSRGSRRDAKGHRNYSPTESGVDGI